MNTEQLISEAFERQADRAPDGHRIMAALRERPARKLTRTGVLALVAAAVVAAVAVPVVILTSGRDAAPAAQSAPAPAPRPPGGTPIDYRPAWLPDGLLELRRGLGPTPQEWSRYWRGGPPEACDSRPEVVELRSGPEGPFPPDLPENLYRPIDVNGHPGHIAGLGAVGTPSSQAVVVWRPEPGTQLAVYVLRVPNAVEVALRVARSVTTDQEASVSAPFTLGWRPDGIGPGYSDTGEICDEIASYHAPGPEQGLTVQLRAEKVTTAPGPPERVFTRGRLGTYSNGELVVRLEDGTWLRILGPTNKDVLVKVANSLVIHAEATRPQPWHGTR
jgi:hypothetical protein